MTRYRERIAISPEAMRSCTQLLRQVKRLGSFAATLCPLASRTILNTHTCSDICSSSFVPCWLTSQYCIPSVSVSARVSSRLAVIACTYDHAPTSNSLSDPCAHPPAPWGCCQQASTGLHRTMKGQVMMLTGTSASRRQQRGVLVSPPPSILLPQFVTPAVRSVPMHAGAV